MAASPLLHSMGLVRWSQVLTVRTVGDWPTVVSYSRWVREIRCLDGVLIGCSNKRILSEFSHLYALSIDAHSDVTHTGDQFAYLKTFTFLPSSLVRLEITNAHSPDINIIAIVKRDCPRLEELRLGRCTLFNRSPACDFWRSFPHEHNSYISVSGTEEYAASLAGELAPLRHLNHLRMGIYLISSSIVLAHRLYHARGLAAPADIDWQVAIPLAQQPPGDLADGEPLQIEPATTEDLIDLLHRSDSGFELDQPNCNLCTSQFLDANLAAEAAANRMITELVPSLSSIQWMGWFTRNHLGVNSYTYDTARA
ncbi:hypothetical protein FRC08_004094 [Ceratobasidium sp. 394]|nr:hypothetical protein FRC08_004094 [Ceratobasidium sp. 394]KAG9087268.1 hypothetical protein FS749_003035 [Ceratobasidium sp. UAMH 11750]